MDLSKLSEVFNPVDLEWRTQTVGVTNGKPWAMVLVYVTNRAIMDRLDEVCGPENWQNTFAEGPGGGIICGISIKCGDEWITKWDGADKTQIEAVKGGLSGAMKRAGVQWGIGRYLYNLEATFAKCDTDKRKYPNKGYDKKTSTAFSWETPTLPKWAVPKSELGTPPEVKGPETPKSEPWMGHEWKDEKQRKLFVGMVSTTVDPDKHGAFEKYLVNTMNVMNEAAAADNNKPIPQDKQYMSAPFIEYAKVHMTELVNDFHKE